MSLRSWRQARKDARLRHTDSVPDDQFRLLLLTDDPWPTYIGQRAWCSGKPYWEDRRCECAHTERRTS